MQKVIWHLAVALVITRLPAWGDGSVIQSFQGNGSLTWSNPASPSRYSIEWASSMTGTWSRSWEGLADQVTTSSVVTTCVPMFYRVVCATNPFGGGLVAYYPFSGNADDASGNGNTGTVIGAQLTSDRTSVPGSAYLFANDGDRVYVPSVSALNLSTQLSLCAWVRLDQTANDYQEIVAKWYSNGGYDASYELTFTPNSSAPSLVLVVGGRLQLDSSVSLSTGQWSSVVGTFDGVTATIYVNGKQGGLASWPGVVSQGNSPLMIGAHDSSSDRNQFHGAIDEVRVYNRALTSNEVQQLHAYGP